MFTLLVPLPLLVMTLVVVVVLLSLFELMLVLVLMLLLVPVALEIDEAAPAAWLAKQSSRAAVTGIFMISFRRAGTC
jgi:hypothetical protein